MNSIEIKIPNDGLNNVVTTTKIVKWFVQNNTLVEKNQILLKLENDFYELELPSEYDGVIHLIKQEGDIVKIGDIVCYIEF